MPEKEICICADNNHILIGLYNWEYVAFQWTLFLEVILSNLISISHSQLLQYKYKLIKTKYHTSFQMFNIYTTSGYGIIQCLAGDFHFHGKFY